MCTHSEIVLKVLHEILNMHLDTFDRKRDLSMEHDLNLFYYVFINILKLEEISNSGLLPLIFSTVHRSGAVHKIICCPPLEILMKVLTFNIFPPTMEGDGMCKYLRNFATFLA